MINRETYTYAGITLSVKDDYSLVLTGLPTPPFTVTQASYSSLVTLPTIPEDLDLMCFSSNLPKGTGQLECYHKGLYHYATAMKLLNVTISEGKTDLYSNDVILERSLLEPVISGKTMIYSIALSWLRFWRKLILSTLYSEEDELYWYKAYYLNLPKNLAASHTTFLSLHLPLSVRVSGVEDAISRGA
jgi:hypothetical protein